MEVYHYWSLLVWVMGQRKLEIKEKVDVEY
jgi:hypothetical protein